MKIFLLLACLLYCYVSVLHAPHTLGQLGATLGTHLCAVPAPHPRMLALGSHWH